MSRLRAETMPRRHRAAEAERIADRDHPFAEPQLVGIAELHRMVSGFSGGFESSAARDRFSCRLPTSSALRLGAVVET
jgi:hypothetical protein